MVLSITAPIMAAENQEPLTLQQIVNTAIKNNPQLLESQKRWEQKTGGISVASAWSNPKNGIMKDDSPNIVVGQNGNVPVYVKNVARVNLGPDFRRGVLTKSGQEAAGGIVIQRMGANTIDVIDQFKEKITEIQGTCISPSRN